MDMNTIKKISKKRELAIAKDTGGKAHSCSGALWHLKSDASDSYFQYEDKFTAADKYSVKLKSLRKIEKEAFAVGKIPAFRFGFIYPGGSSDYVILRKQDCVFLQTTATSITTMKQSVMMHQSWLENIHRNVSDNILLQIIFNDAEYILIEYSDFLSVREDIMRGTPI